MAGETTAKGLGWQHQQLRARLLPYAYGRPCPMCGHRMLRGQRLDLDHATPRVHGGHNGPRRIVHARCNRRAGQAIAVARRRARAQDEAIAAAEPTNFEPRLRW